MLEEIGDELGNLGVVAQVGELPDRRVGHRRWPVDGRQVSQCLGALAVAPPLGRERRCDGWRGDADVAPSAEHHASVDEAAERPVGGDQRSLTGARAEPVEDRQGSSYAHRSVVGLPAEHQPLDRLGVWQLPQLAVTAVGGLDEQGGHSRKASRQLCEVVDRPVGKDRTAATQEVAHLGLWQVFQLAERALAGSGVGDRFEVECRQAEP